MKKILILIFYGLTIGASAQTNCKGLDTRFRNYDDAVAKVRNFSFSYVDKANTSRSSWIRGAEYYSCDKQYGFMILRTDYESYIHQRVPINIWIGFKNARSLGSYYSNYIRGRFQIEL